MVPVWAMLVVWWALALYFHPLGVKLSWRLPIVHLLGYLLYVGTGWFVTMILQLVVLFPASNGCAAGSVCACCCPGASSHRGHTWYSLALLGFFSRTPAAGSTSTSSARVLRATSPSHALAEHRKQLGRGGACSPRRCSPAAAGATSRASVSVVAGALWIGVLALTRRAALRACGT
jgi:hypothetical protein